MDVQLLGVAFAVDAHVLAVIAVRPLAQRLIKTPDVAQENAAADTFGKRASAAGAPAPGQVDGGRPRTRTTTNSVDGT